SPPHDLAAALAQAGARLSIAGEEAGF
ncbi:DeoR/GlpR transcriptional regulator, partial [Mesorhizobium sp. M7A.T.Ca.TU.009.01.1.2]